MQGSRFLSLVRTFTISVPPNHNAFTSYYKNQTLNELIKSGRLNDAQNLFNQMSTRDSITYNLLISGHGRYGNPNRSLYLYREMVSQGIKETGPTFSSVITVCGSGGLYREGIQVHCRVLSLGLGLNLFIGSSLVNFYLHMGFDDLAFKLFDQLPDRNLAVWNLMLDGFLELGKIEELFGLHGRMGWEGVKPNGLSFCYLIRACCNGRFVDEGKQLHCLAIKAGWVECNVFVANALVDFYSASGNFIDARKAFSLITVEDVISWNSIISVYAENDLLCDSLELFSRMHFWGKKPSVRSFLGFLKFSSRRGDIIFGRQIHCFVMKIGFDSGSVHIQSALIDMYGKCGDAESSLSVYESACRRTLVCCNSLTTSLLHCGITEDVFEMFSFMVDEGIGPDEVTLSAALKALSVSSWVSLDSCRMLHCYAIKSGYESDIAVSCSLIDAYSRCGHFELSCKVFEALPLPNVFCFTSIINVHARNGTGRECVSLLEAIIQKGLIPDKVTFLCVLNGCNHAGLVEEGKLVFNLMKSFYGICPERQHFSCMIDLLGHAGLLDEAEEFLQQAPEGGDSVMWSSLLRSCGVHKNEIVGKRAAKVLMELGQEDFAIYLQVSNFYSEIGEFESALQIREIAMARKVMREIGHSLIEVKTCS
ncbi:hypothetical protein DITRI_Ditri17bG0064500 [Diplodiscus trichospermus]